MPALYGPLLVVGAAALAAAWAAGLRLLEERARAGRLSPLVPAAGALAALAGAAALVWPGLARAPYGAVLDFAAQPWMPVAGALAGSALAGRVRAVRITGLALASTAFVAAAAGPLALALNLLGCLPGFFVERSRGAHAPRGVLRIHLLLLGAVGAALTALRMSDPTQALTGWGIYVFAALRHLSFVRCVRSAPELPFPSLPEYLCYLLFFTNCVGAMEVFDEFRARNLSSDQPPDLGAALARVGLGTAQLAVALLIPASLDAALAAPSFLGVWREILTLFVRSSLAVTGTWATLDGTALFLGVRLRANFRGILFAASPTEFWHAWRATMTRWMIQNIYIPLGGNRRHRLRNVAAVFAFSTLWHCAGTAFLLGERMVPAALLPIAAWGGLSLAGVLAHGALRARRAPAERPLAAALGVRALKIGGTWVYGSFSVTLLELSLGDPARFGVFLRRIVGLF